MGARVEALLELAPIEAQILSDPMQDLLAQAAGLALEEGVVIGRELSLICGTLGGHRGFQAVGEVRELPEREAGIARPDELIEKERLELSREDPAAGSTEVPPVDDLQGSPRIAERCALDLQSIGRARRRVIRSAAGDQDRRSTQDKH